MIFSFNDKTPKIEENVFLAEGSQVIGEVQIGEKASVWYNSVIRGDLASITIGKRSNIQDLSVLHVNRNQPLVIEDEVSIGHSVVLHGCTIKSGSLIGMGTIILNNSIIGEETLVAAGSLIPENKTYPPRVLLMGSPARVIRELTEEEIESLHQTAERYYQKAIEHQENKIIRLD